MFLRVLQLNTRHYYTNRHILATLIQDTNPDIVLLNSTCTRHDQKIKHYGYTSRQTDGLHDGVAILVKHTLKHTFLTHTWTTPHFLAVTIHTNTGPINFATTYVRPDTQLPYTDLNTLFNHSNTPTFLLADLNARHATFFHTTTNNLGRQLYSFYTRKRLQFLGPDFDTFFAPGRTGRPDLVLANRAANIFHSHLAPGPLSGSDHIPVILTVSVNPILIPATSRFLYKNVDWYSYKQTLNIAEYTTHYNNRPTHIIDQQWQHIHQLILTTANTHIPKTNYSLHYNFKTSRTKRLLACYRRRFEINKHNLAQVHFELNILRRHILHSLDTDRRLHWTQLVHRAETHRKHNPREFWKHIKRLQGSHYTTFDYLRINNTYITDPEDIITTFKQHWQPIYKPHPPHPLARPTIDTVTDFLINNDTHTPEPIIRLDNLHDHILSDPISVDEVGLLLARTPKKSSGSSGITYHMIHHLPRHTIQAITHLYNAQLASGYFPELFKTATATLIPKPNKDNTHPLNYRPISLLEILGKTFERIMNNRIRLHLETEELLSQKHFGFRQQRSTQSALNVLTNYLYITKSRRLHTALITKDIQKAFDTVWHAGLRYKLCTPFRFPINVQRLLCDYLSHRKMQIKF